MGKKSKVEASSSSSAPTGGRVIKRKERRDEMSAAMDYDPSYLNIDERAVIKDKRFDKLFDADFPILETKKDALSRKRDFYYKQALKDIYNFDDNRGKQSEIERLQLLSQQIYNSDEDREEEEEDDEEDEEEETITRESLGIQFDNGKDKSEEKVDNEDKEHRDMILKRQTSSNEYIKQFEKEDSKHKDKVTDFSDDEVEIYDDIVDQPKEDMWGQLHQAKTLAEGSETNRLALVNIGWDTIHSKDIFVLMQSMLPDGGKIESVKIYLSDFGKETMEKEKKYGPDVSFKTEEELLNYLHKIKDFKEYNEKRRLERFITKMGKDKKSKKRTEFSFEEAGNEILDPDKLRRYEIQKLKYYFAVIECDSIETASSLYENVDGREIQKTRYMADLRFIPDSQSFKGREIKDECNSFPENYTPKFRNSNIHHSNLGFSWDDGEDERRILKKTDFSNVKEHELMQFIASSSESDSSSDEEEKRTGDKDEKKGEGFVVKVPFEPVKKKKKKKSKKERKKEKKKYKELLKVSQLETNLNQTHFDKSQEMDVAFEDISLRDKAQEIVDKIKAKNEDEGLTAWQLAEKRRKLRQQMKKAEKREKRMEEQNNDSGDNHSDLEDMTNETLKNKIKKERKLKKEQKEKANLELLLMDYKTSTDKKGSKLDGFNVKSDSNKEITRRTKNKSKVVNEDEDFNVNLKDSRFNPVFEDAEFNIDPTHPKFKKSKNTQEILVEKRKRREIQKQKVESGVTLESKTKQTDGPSDRMNQILKNLKSKKRKSSQLGSTKEMSKTKKKKMK